MGKDDIPLASRSASACPLGKRTEKVRCGNIPLEVKHGLDRMRAEAGGMSEAEYLSKLVIIHVIGVDAYRRLQEQELTRFANVGQELDKA